MAKSKIIKELVNNEVSVEIALKRLLLLAHNLDNEELINWINKELNGYKKNDNIPEYRRIVCTNFIYTGFNMGCQVKNVALPVTWFNPDTAVLLAGHVFTESVATFEKLSKKDDLSLIDITEYAGEIEKNSNGGIKCLDIKQVFSPYMFDEILKKISLKILDILLKLEKEFGILDDLDIDIANKKIKDKINKDININVISSKSTTISLGDSNNINNNVKNKDCNNEKKNDIRIDTKLVPNKKKNCFLRLFSKKNK